MHIWVDFWMLDPYARYGVLNGFGILVHAQLSFWGPGKQLLENTIIFDVVLYQPQYGAFATSKLGAAVSGCLRRVRTIQKEVFLEKCVPIAVSDCLRWVRILKSDVSL